MNIRGNCQSCGMPLKADPEGGGRNADGSLSTLYCSYCYADGRFRDPNMSLDEMRALVIDKLQAKGLPRWLARWFAASLPRLARWR